MVKIRAEINKIESRKIKVGSFKINKMDKSLARLTQIKREKTWIISISKKEEDVTIYLSSLRE